MSRSAELDHLYEVLADLEDRLGGKRTLAASDGRASWPARGVYFFFEAGERREKGEPRVVRVGTHALTATSRTTLWGRLAQHRGNVAGSMPGGGNHCGSVFRLHVGAAMLAAGGWPEALGDTWARGSTGSAEIRTAERELERAVSTYIGVMPFLWVDVGDAPGPGSDRARIERGSIALLSNFERPPIDPPSEGWLGRRSPNSAVRMSGLWNVNHVREPVDPGFLDVLASYVERTKASRSPEVSVEEPEASRQAEERPE